MEQPNRRKFLIIAGAGAGAAAVGVAAAKTGIAGSDAPPAGTAGAVPAGAGPLVAYVERRRLRPRLADGRRARGRRARPRPRRPAPRRGGEDGLMSSHREAPEISKDPVADNTDVYAFVSPTSPDTSR